MSLKSTRKFAVKTVANFENSASRWVAATFKAIEAEHDTIRRLTITPTTPGAGVSNGYMAT